MEEGKKGKERNRREDNNGEREGKKRRERERKKRKKGEMMDGMKRKRKGRPLAFCFWLLYWNILLISLSLKLDEPDM